MSSSVKDPDLKSINILLVDDDSDEFYLFNEALEHTGLVVTMKCINNVNALHEYLQNNHYPDIIFLDLNMPYKDGLEWLRDIRNNPILKDAKVVIYSTTKISSMVKDCYNAGADLFVVKPEDFLGMVKVVQQVCTTDWLNFSRPAINSGFIITSN